MATIEVAAVDSKVDAVATVNKFNLLSLKIKITSISCDNIKKMKFTGEYITVREIFENVTFINNDYIYGVDKREQVVKITKDGILFTNPRTILSE